MRVSDMAVTGINNEDQLVQATFAAHLKDALGWDTVYAFNEETFGHTGTLGRKDATEAVLTRDLRAALVRLNEGLPSAAIDMAMHGVAKRRLGVPQDARSAFELLAVERVIDRELAERMKLMVGFRNRAIHEYQQLQIGILRRILEERLADLPRLARQLLDA